METRKFNIPQGKINTEQLIGEIKDRTGLDEVSLTVNNGGEFERLVVVNGKLEKITENVPPSLEITIADPSKFGQAEQAVQAHNPQKDDTEVVEERKVSELEAQVANLPLIQKLIADVANLKAK